TPVREALNRLVHEGVLEEVPYRGIFIRTFTLNQINDIYEVRKALEVLAIKLAIRNMSDEEMAEVVEIVNIIADAKLNNDITSYSRWDAEFHKKIAYLSKNESLIHMLHLMDKQIRLIRQMVNKNS